MCHGCAMVKLHGLLSLSLGDGHQSTFIRSIPCKDFHRMDDRQQYTHTLVKAAPDTCGNQLKAAGEVAPSCGSSHSNFIC